MSYIVKLLVKAGQILLPWIIEGVAGFFKKLYDKHKANKDKAEKEAELKALQEKEKQAKSAKEQEDAFKDIVDRSNKP